LSSSSSRVKLVGVPFVRVETEFNVALDSAAVGQYAQA
jgi:hypothetical protein